MKHYYETVREFRARWPKRLVLMTPENALLFGAAMRRPGVFIVLCRDRHRGERLQRAFQQNLADKVRNERFGFIRLESGAEIRFVSSVEQVRGLEPESILCEA